MKVFFIFAIFGLLISTVLAGNFFVGGKHKTIVPKGSDPAAVVNKVYGAGSGNHFKGGNHGTVAANPGNSPSGFLAKMAKSVLG